MTEKQKAEKIRKLIVGRDDGKSARGKILTMFKLVKLAHNKHEYRHAKYHVWPFRDVDNELDD